MGNINDIVGSTRYLQEVFLPEKNRIVYRTYDYYDFSQKLDALQHVKEVLLGSRDIPLDNIFSSDEKLMSLSSEVLQLLNVLDKGFTACLGHRLFIPPDRDKYRFFNVVLGTYLFDELCNQIACLPRHFTVYGSKFSNHFHYLLEQYITVYGNQQDILCFSLLNERGNYEIFFVNSVKDLSQVLDEYIASHLSDLENEANFILESMEKYLDGGIV